MVANARMVDPAGERLSRSSAEMLLDLVEIKLGCLEVWDRDDARELKTLARARDELAALLGRPSLPRRAAKRSEPALLHA